MEKHLDSRDLFPHSLPKLLLIYIHSHPMSVHVVTPSTLPASPCLLDLLLISDKLFVLVKLDLFMYTVVVELANVNSDNLIR